MQAAAVRITIAALDVAIVAASACRLAIRVTLRQDVALASARALHGGAAGGCAHSAAADLSTISRGTGAITAARPLHKSVLWSYGEGTSVKSLAKRPMAAGSCSRVTTAVRFAHALVRLRARSFVCELGTAITYDFQNLARRRQASGQFVSGSGPYLVPGKFNQEFYAG